MVSEEKEEDVSIKDGIYRILEQDFAIDKTTINGDTKLEDLKIDLYSFDAVTLLSNIENTFKIEIDADDFTKIKNVDGLIDVVQECLKKKVEAENSSEQ